MRFDDVLNLLATDYKTLNFHYPLSGTHALISLIEQVRPAFVKIPIQQIVCV